MVVRVVVANRSLRWVNFSQRQGGPEGLYGPLEPIGKAAMPVYYGHS